jgi:TRAP transporter TAXI family solute receptor
MESAGQHVNRMYAGSAIEHWRQAGWWLYNGPMIVALIRRLTVAAVIGGILATGQAVADRNGAEVRFFRIATGNIAGTYFPIGSIIASVISSPPGSRACEDGGSCGVKGLVAAAQATKGSIENVRRISSGESESGFSQADVAYWAYNGFNMFLDDEPHKKLRVIAALYPEVVHVGVLKKSGITSITELKGRRIAIGPLQSGTAVDAAIVLQAYGLRKEDYSAKHIEMTAAADALLDGTIDAFIQVGGYPVPIIAALAEEAEMALLPVNDIPRDSILLEHPFFSEAVIPADAYNGVAAVDTIAVGAQWLVSADVDADLVYKLTRALWHPSTRGVLDKSHPKGQLIQRETALKGVGIPLHDGAKRFYLEAGMLQQNNQ